MKTKELIKRVEELGFIAYEDGDYWSIKDENEDILGNVNKTTLSQVCTDFIGWDEIYNEDKEKLFNLIVEYARTPLDEREEEKRFHLRHRWIFDKDFYWYLKRDTYDKNEMRFGIINFSGNDGVEFTLKEIEEIKEKFHTDLNDFELVEVEE